MKDYVKCLSCGYESARSDFYLDIPLTIRPFGSEQAYGSVVSMLCLHVKLSGCFILILKIMFVILILIVKLPTWCFYGSCSFYTGEWGLLHRALQNERNLYFTVTHRTSRVKRHSTHFLCRIYSRQPAYSTPFSQSDVYPSTCCKLQVTHSTVTTNSTCHRQSMSSPDRQTATHSEPMASASAFQTRYLRHDELDEVWQLIVDSGWHVSMNILMACHAVDSGGWFVLERRESGKKLGKQNVYVLPQLCR